MPRRATQPRLKVAPPPGYRCYARRDGMIVHVDDCPKYEPGTVTDPRARPTNALVPMTTHHIGA